MKPTPDQAARMAQHFEQANRQRYGDEEPFLGSAAALIVLGTAALALIVLAMGLGQLAGMLCTV